VTRPGSARRGLSAHGAQGAPRPRAPRAGLLGSEEQKRELLPRMAQLQLIGAWGLTEPSNGSDASALTSTARKVGRGAAAQAAEPLVGCSMPGRAPAALGVHAQLSHGAQEVCGVQGQPAYGAQQLCGVQGSQPATVRAARRPCEAVAGGATSGACA